MYVVFIYVFLAVGRRQLQYLLAAGSFSTCWPPAAASVPAGVRCADLQCPDLLLCLAGYIIIHEEPIWLV